ncbi:hypothetical protein [Corynebacterium macclintockiae]|uniref:hypothetical protein n=1 Tax=Corynebacterium macclintockiae TaxID=2913501 RepID=UPI003EBFCDD0
MTTKHNRWKVWRDTTMEAHGDPPWIGAPERNWQYRSNKYAFPTHAEALAYADRMARTVTVELPADPNKHAPYMGYEAGLGALPRHQFGAPDWEPSNKISLERSQIEPFALALLAHHYRSTAP